MSHRAVIALLALVVAMPLAAQVGQQARRPRPAAFPLSVTVYGALNGYGTRARQLDPIFFECTTTSCIDHAFTKGPGLGVEAQVPLFATLGFAAGLEGLTMLQTQCIRGGSCVTTDRLVGQRARAELLFRLKARAPIYFGIGAAALRTAPGAVNVQDDPTVAIGPAFSIGGDFQVSPRAWVRVAWHSYLPKTDNANLPATYETVTPHDGSLTIGARFTFSR